MHIKGIPIIASNMATGNFHMADQLSQHKMFTAIAKHNNWRWMNYFKEPTYDSLREIYSKYCFYTIGMCYEELDELNKFYGVLTGGQIDAVNRNDLMICIDIANGYSQKFASWVNEIRSHFPYNVIMAGNVCTPEMTQELILAGADIIKVGIGPGAHCSTRMKTGVGMPQLTAIIECADVAHGLDALICADGGITYPGDIAKAFGANADFVMIGTMFAGTDQCEGDIITKWEHDGTYTWDTSKEAYNKPTWEPNVVEKKYKQFYGMSSDVAPGNAGKNKDYRTSEGIVSEVPYKGDVNAIIMDILGGLRSACTYIGARNLKSFGKCATFQRVNNQK
jgi:GMP reductase